MSNQKPGTVYGRGAVDARPPRQGRAGGLHPAVLALVGGAALVLVVALGYWVLRSPAEVEPVAAPASSAAAAPAATTPAAATSSAQPERLSTGLWTLALKADPKRFLTKEDDFAAVKRDDPLVLTVLPGLADDECFTFRDEEGDYLRHFDYRLRFDESDGSDLFRSDATFCLEDGLPAGTVRLRSKNYPDHALHRRDSQLYIDEPDGSAQFRAESTFTVREPVES